MRLSEAIALGRVMLRPVAGTVSDSYGGGCAIGMAIAACGRMDTAPVLNPTGILWPWTDAMKFTAYPCGCRRDFYGTNQVATTITHLFDAHVMDEAGNWTLDQLIDWVRSVEPSEPVQLADSPAAQEVLSNSI